MTPKFDQIINEFLTSKNKRRTSRYWQDTQFPSGGDIRKVKARNNRSSSQNTKIDQDQQYVGNIWDAEGIRGQNKSRKDSPNAGIAKGLGNHLRISGVNPKKPGSKVNSKQGHMEVKATLPNGLSRIGSTGKKDYFSSSTKRKFLPK